MIDQLTTGQIAAFLLIFIAFFMLIGYAMAVFGNKVYDWVRDRVPYWICRFGDWLIEISRDRRE